MRTTFAVAVAVLIVLMTACSAEPTDNASACRDFEKAFTARAGNRMSDQEYAQHVTADKKASSGKLGQIFRLDYIYPNLISQECRTIGVPIELTAR